MKQQYRALYNELCQFIAPERLIHDELRTLAYGTDASFYRLIPQLVVRVDNEAEVSRVLQLTRQHQLPVTFRAAGTSLSGQAVTDSVLIQLSSNWRGYQIHDHGHRVSLQPGIIGGKANLLLAPFQRKIGPDPASINACMIGGIAANNASGMCCGTAQNSYNTVESMKVIMADGTLLNTADPESRQAFTQTHGELLQRLQQLGEETRANTELASLIRHKYRLKNTTGYSLNSLVDYSDPFDILLHLMIGSEGTLGFISEVTYKTVVEHPIKAAALIFYPDMEAACRAVVAMKPTPVAAVELIDRAGLRAVEDKAGMPALLKTLGSDATALLVDVRASERSELEQKLAEVNQALHGIPTLSPVEFTEDADTYALYWKIRKGLFPAVGAVRNTGTTVIIEDVAFPIEQLSEGVLELQRVFQKYDYQEALLFGHALEGNLHFVFTQGFDDPKEVERYQHLMDEVAQLVAVKYKGSLKAEHGTGRNMAPFVELEWGKDAYNLMWALKAAFDPENLLNPDVILTRNPNLHLENLKPLPPAHQLVDKCIECGFCESSCPSRNLSLTPRQRIVVQREIKRLEASGEDIRRLKILSDDYAYQGVDTCAGCGLCEMQCPVGINTGDLTRSLRHERSQAYTGTAAWLGSHFEGVANTSRIMLNVADGIHAVVGSKAMSAMTSTARKLSGNRVQQWTPSMPKAAPKMATVLQQQPPRLQGDKVVYLPSCATRIMGAARNQGEDRSTPEVAMSLLNKAGFSVLFPEALGAQCCGMPFQSKGQFETANAKAEELNQALLKATDNGRYPVFCDTSPCLMRMRDTLDSRLRLYEQVEFIHDFVLPRLTIQQKTERIALHVTCSTTKMGLASKMIALANACAKEVVIPPDITCCGFAGDKGFTHPELNASALKDLPSAVVGCEQGYSNSRTCEIGLSEHSGIPYQSIIYLVDRLSEGKR
ncbi:D-lactate dehydrogenase [Oceanospirillum multiglobuliferum]|uniref:D-lactate dehydrogenase (cytochrome) n=1 Tax=Oceanospirillum multiglobuliferum TaxID=64969 RepID=A0A1T4QP89_9GAMM|nr:FAD-binding and (Fe-S)-binding domain-containing protein [Oceanospirillum multiglobuliferum]OPX56468.1 4Fe-4S ferredoxin [Oceanospirillum multiglobuliferum]SKA05505.1 D-lactate dehydrogenase [Oceanospirillum multiglobuliferum]